MDLKKKLLILYLLSTITCDVHCYNNAKFPELVLRSNTGLTVHYKVYFFYVEYNVCVQLLFHCVITNNCKLSVHIHYTKHQRTVLFASDMTFLHNFGHTHLTFLTVKLASLYMETCASNGLATVSTKKTVWVVACTCGFNTVL